MAKKITIKNKKQKKRAITKKIKRTNKKVKRGGNSNEEIDLRQILLTKPIMNAVKEYNPDINLGEYKLSKSEHGFGLSRMEQMMESDFTELLEKEPVKLKVARTSDGKMIGTKIDGVMKKMYEIIDGRHRITRALIDGHKNIKAIII